jgi:serine/threonine protein kinase
MDEERKKDPIAYGGSANVYSFNGRAVKKYRAGDGWEKVFRNEVEILLSVEHPNIVKLLYPRIDDGICYLELELGEFSLDFRLFAQNTKLYPPIDVPTRMTYACEIGGALIYLHGFNILHRDVGLANIVTFKQGKQVKLVDFGTAVKLAPKQLGYSSDFPIGSPFYRSPEARLPEGTFRDYTAKSDVYGFGKCLLALVLREPPPWNEDDDVKWPSGYAKENQYFLNAFWNKDPKSRPEIKTAIEPLQMKKLFTVK